MINKLDPIREYLLVDGDGETCGTIKTTYPYGRCYELIQYGGFKYKKEIVAAIKEKGYYCF